MDANVNVIIGFLGGSLMTLVIREIFGFVKSRIAFRRDLAKQLFARKLEIGEKVVAYNVAYVQRLTTIIVLIEEMKESLRELNFLGKESLWSNLTKYSNELTEFEKVSSDNRDSAYLYFSIDHQVGWNEDLTRSGYKYTIQFQSRVSELDSLNKLFLAESNPEKKDILIQDAQERIRALAEPIHELTRLANTQKEDMIKVINQIKKELND